MLEVLTMESHLRASVSLCKGVHDIMGDNLTEGQHVTHDKIERQLLRS